MTRFADDFLTDACGVPVTTTARGRVTIFTFPNGTVLQEHDHAQHLAGGHCG